MPGTRALVLAGGGIRVAWQAGAVQALDEAGLVFDHGDGTSGGIFTLGMLLSGVAPSELGERWRTLKVRRFLSLLPFRSYLRSPTNWSAVGGASGIIDQVLPHLGVDLDRIRSCERMTGTFNVADFDTKTCVAIPHDEIDLDRLVAGVSLPIFLPAVKAGGRTWTDAVWIKDANLLDAVRRGCSELWLLWCIANTPYWGNGPLEQYVHMIELSANGALFSELAQIADINERRRRGEAVYGTTEPVTLHVVKPTLPLPLDPDFVAGRISAETLVAMGYRDAWGYLRSCSGEGTALDSSATRMAAAPLGARLSLRLRGDVSVTGSGAVDRSPLTLSLTVEVNDLQRFVADPQAGTSVVGALHHRAWGYRPFVAASFSVRETDGVRRFVASATILVDGEQLVVEATSAVGSGAGASPRFVVEVHPADASDPIASGTCQISRGDLLRVLFFFEPTGAHDLHDRARALAATVGFLTSQRRR